MSCESLSFPTRTARGPTRVLRISVALGICVCFAGAVQATTIAEWDVAGSDGQTALVLTSAPDTSATDLVPVGVTGWPGGFCCFTAASGWGSGVIPDLAKYYEFSTTADPGHAILYQDITLSLFRGIQGANHGAELWELRSSVDGFAAPVLSFDLSASAADEQVLFANQDISSLGSQFGTVTFRLYGFDYTAATDYSGLGAHPGPTPLSGTGSNLSIEGVILPEPGTGLLVALGLAVLGLRARRATPDTRS